MGERRPKCGNIPNNNNKASHTDGPTCASLPCFSVVRTAVVGAWGDGRGPSVGKKGRDRTETGPSGAAGELYQQINKYRKPSREEMRGE